VAAQWAKGAKIAEEKAEAARAAAQAAQPSRVVNFRKVDQKKGKG
jgi:hypothetical protein